MEISVIIPAYNAVGTIENCICSLTSQRRYDLLKEIIIVDDGSKDATYDVCCLLSEKEKKIKIISQKNAGVSAARNRGIAEASGEYILFVDADDSLEEDFFNVLEKCGDADFIVCPYKVVNGSSVEKKLYRTEGIGTGSGRIGELISAVNLGYVWGKFFKREIMVRENIEFNEALSYGEDNLFVLIYCRYIKSCLVMNHGFYRYTAGQGMSLSKKYVKDLALYCFEFEKAQHELFCRYETYKQEFTKWCPNIQLLESRNMIRNIFRHGSPYCSFRERTEFVKNEYERIEKPLSLCYMCHTGMDYLFNLLNLIGSPSFAVLILSIIFIRR